MANVFDLFGEIKVKTDDLPRELGRIQSRLEGTERALDRTEKKAKKLGDTTQTTARKHQKLGDRLKVIRGQLADAKTKYDRGEISSKAYAAAVSKAARDTKRLGNATKDAGARMNDFGNRMEKAAKKSRSLGKIGFRINQIGRGISSAGRAMIPFSLGLAALAIGAVKGADNIFQLQNKLTASTGSFAKGNKVLTEYIALSKSSVGVTVDFAASVDALFRPMKGISEKALPDLVRAIGKLKTANQSLDISHLGLNLAQLFQEGFEKKDLKELFTAFPRIGQILAEQFGGDGSLEGMQTVLQGLRKNGKLTMASWIEGFSKAVNEDKALSLLEDGFLAKLGKLVVPLQIAIAPVGNAIIKAIQPIIDVAVPAIQMLGKFFGNLPAPIQTAIVAFGAFLAILAPIFIIVGTLVSGIGSLLVGISGLAAAFGITASAGVIVGVALLAVYGLVVQLTPPLLLAAAAAITLFKAWQTNFGGIRDFTDKIATSINDLWNKALVEIRAFTDSILSDISKFWEENGEDIKRAIKVATETWKALISAALNLITRFWKNHGEQIKSIASGMWTIIKTVVKAGVLAVLDIIKIVTAIINGDWSKAWETAKKLVARNWEAIKTVVAAGIQNIFTLIQGIVDFVANIGIALLRAGYDAGANLVQGFVDGITANLPSAKGVVNRLGQLAISAMTNRLILFSPSKVFYDIGVNTVQGFINGIRSKELATSEALETIIGKAIDKLVKPKRIKATELMANKLGFLRDVLKDIGFIKEPTVIERLSKLVNDGSLSKQIDAVAKSLGKTGAELKAMVATMLRLEGLPVLKALPNGAGVGGGIGPINRGTGNIGSNIGLPTEGFTLTGATQATLDTSTPGPLGPPPRLIPAWENFFKTFKTKLASLRESLPSFKEAIGKNLIDSIYGLGDALAENLTNWEGGLKGFFGRLKSSFAQLVQDLIAQAIKLLVIKSIMNAIGGLFGNIGGGGGFGGGDLSFDTGAGGFATGGFTGNAPINKPVGVVHGREMVINAAATRAIGVANLEHANRTGQMPPSAGGARGDVFVTMNVTATDAGSFNHSRHQITRDLTTEIKGHLLKGKQ